MEAFSDEELIDELQQRGYSIRRFGNEGVVPEAEAKRIRFDHAVPYAFADRVALDIWKASCEGAKTS